MKTLSLRLPDEQAAALEAIAQADEVSVSETIRQAIDSQINQRRDDAEFQKRLRVAMERNQKALELLAK
jgi:predicted transcriptional regulator